MTTKIAWCDEAWNPVTGCTPVSAGCANCYAAAVAKRFWKGRKFSEVRLILSRTEKPFSWKKPRRVFVNSMGDLFHESVPDSWLSHIFRIMLHSDNRRHTFIVLTKRPERMKAFLAEWIEWTWSMKERRCDNVWLGVTAENQAMADERIPILLETPAAVRFVSVEPMLEEIDLEKVPLPDQYLRMAGVTGCLQPLSEKETEPDDYRYWMRKGYKLDWIIAGAESGPKRRPFDLDWARSLRDQCQAANVPFFFKQGHDESGKVVHMPELDGVVHAEFPEARV